MELKKLIKLSIKKDKKAFEKLYSRYAPVFLGVCRRYTNSYDEADDILQEAFIKIYNNLEKLKDKNLFESWGKRIVINTAIRAIQKRKVFNLQIDIEKFDIEEETDHNDEISTEIMSKMDISDLIKLMNYLPEGYRTILNLYAVEDYSHKEIAEILNIREVTSRSQYFKAKKAFQKILLEQVTITRHEKVNI